MSEARQAKKIPLIKCPSCSGKGKVPLAKIMADVLTIIAFRPGLNTDEIRLLYVKRHAPLEPTAMSNRLAYLFRHGLVTREKQGKFWHWSAK